MYNSSLKDYIKIYKGFYEPDFCASVVTELANANWILHAFHDPINNSYKSYDDDLHISYHPSDLKNQIDVKIPDIIRRYIFNDMSYMSKWFYGWSGYTYCRFNKYDQGTDMKPHCDHIHTLFDGTHKGVPILTILGTLNDSYDGGEFVLCGEHIELKTGDVIVFPSNFLYPHEVKSIKSGTRYSFVSWAW